MYMELCSFVLLERDSSGRHRNDRFCHQNSVCLVGVDVLLQATLKRAATLHGCTRFAVYGQKEGRSVPESAFMAELRVEEQRSVRSV